MVAIKTESEEEIAELLYTHQEQQNNAPKPSHRSNQQGGQAQAEALGNMTPDQLRQQAMMMRSMPPSQIRMMNPQMAGFSDEQIQMAANQMEMMASNPEMMKQMTEQMKNMSPAELEQVKRMQAGGAPAMMPTRSAAPAPAATAGGQAANGMQSMANMSPEQLKQQASMMKTMDKNTLRSMNPAMANWSDSQIQMAIQQMETMANNPDMMKQMTEQVKGMKPEDIEKLKKMAAGGDFGAEGMDGTGAGAAGAGANGMPTNPMDMLKNSNPAQIKQMLNMVKENPQLMKDMLRSSNPAMADKMTDEQIQKTIDTFAGLDESKIGWLLKVVGWVQAFRNSSKAKVALFFLLSMFVFVVGMLIHLVRKSKALDDANVGVNDIPPVPVMEESEF